MLYSTRDLNRLAELRYGIAADRPRSRGSTRPIRGRSDLLARLETIGTALLPLAEPAKRTSSKTA